MNQFPVWIWCPPDIGPFLSVCGRLVIRRFVHVLGSEIENFVLRCSSLNSFILADLTTPLVTSAVTAQDFNGLGTETYLFSSASGYFSRSATAVFAIRLISVNRRTTVACVPQLNTHHSIP